VICIHLPLRLGPSPFPTLPDAVGKKELLCKVHYKARFNAAGGVYAGSGKFAKQSERELVSADRASRSTGDSSSPAPVKAGTGLEKDANYTLERSVTTPDKRPSLLMPKDETAASEAEKAPEIMSRRASLKSTGNTRVAEEIAEENSRSASTPSRTAVEATVFTKTEEEAAPAPAVEEEAAPADAGCAKCDCGNGCTACGTDACACTDTCACKQAAAAEESCCAGGTCGGAAAAETEAEATAGDAEDEPAAASCAKCDCGNGCTACGTDACQCDDDCACKK